MIGGTMRSSKSIAPERIRCLNGRETAALGKYVLYWMQSAQRAEDNPALEFAVQRANALGLPLVTAFALTPDYPEANLRHYTFMLEGLFETLQVLRRRGILPFLRLGHPPKVIADLACEAAELVVDRGYLRNLRSWYKEVSQTVTCRFFQVEGEAVVPVELASTKVEHAARTIRPRIKKHLDDFLYQLLPTKLDHKADELSLSPFELGTEQVSEFLKDLPIDRSVKPVSQFYRGGTIVAKRIYTEFLNQWLSDYDVQRNQPQTDYTSVMSPYLHYGMMSAVYLSVTMLANCEPTDPNVESYLEELIIRRGLSQNFALFEPRYDSYSVLPSWAAETLDLHAEDERPDLLNRQQLEAAESHDPYWNAAQVEMVETGYMHNYMRMYWGKKILEWSASPKEAYETTLYLNNKYFLDGRDPASFGNVAWIYGVHDRGWKERAIYGKVRCMMASGLERKNDPRAYVSKIEELTGREVLSKDWLC